MCTQLIYPCSGYRIDGGLLFVQSDSSLCDANRSVGWQFGDFFGMRWDVSDQAHQRKRCAGDRLVHAGDL